MAKVIIMVVAVARFSFKGLVREDAILMFI
jgi:hypothetical protein